MLNRFEFYLKSFKFLNSEAQVLLGVSGGLDSMVLCDLFAKSNRAFAIAHCNFKLRGQESDDDEAFVRKTAEDCGVPFFLNSFATAELAATQQKSVQMLARELRYQWFDNLLGEQGFDFIATAHHLNDSIETLLLNLTRGTGIAGLHGIPPQNGQIIRPLLFATREEIRGYALENSITWREDSSNQSNYYRRNLLRNEIMPLLKQLNPNLEHTLAQSIEKFRGVEAIFREHIHTLRTEVFEEKPEGIYLNYKTLMQKPEAPLRLFYLLEDYGFLYSQCKEIYESLLGISGKVFYSPSHQLTKDRDFLILQLIEKSDKEVHFIEMGDRLLEFKDFNLEIFFSEKNSDFQIPKEVLQAVLDADLLQFPLELRPWHKGDTFYPLGMQHRQKVSDFLINQKVPLPLKSKVKVICSDKEIIWLVGYRIDDRFKVKSDTQRLIHLKKITKH